MKNIKSSTLRTLSVLAVVALVCVGLAIHTGTGTPSAWGIYDIAALCPLGAIEVMIAAKTIVSPVLIGLAVAIVITLLVGRAFCAWGCPVPLLRRVFGLKEPREIRARKTEREIPNKLRGSVHDSRNWVLGGTVLATAAFGFPVFCLICPVGLSFATLIAVWRLFQFSETTLSLLVFPALLIIEVIVLRKWCHRFCPLGALLSLISRGNKTWRPHSDNNTCLQTKGESCRSCAQVCPEGIDLHDVETSAPLNECTKCRICAEKCPAQAITFPFLPQKKKSIQNDSCKGVHSKEQVKDIELESL